MILGLGSDLVDIRRIERLLDRFGGRFVSRVFTDAEQAAAAARGQAADRGLARGGRVATYFASRFAAKEAAAKALGTGFSGGVLWRDFAVVSLPSGRPSLSMTGAAARHLAGLVPGGMVPRIDLSLSDEYPMAQAVVILSAQPSR